MKTRIPPSPTGKFHIGTARTALFNYLLSKSNAATFVMRIEDTDQERSTIESEKEIVEGLNWLGIIPDEGPYAGPHAPYRQSERLNLYDKYIDQLINLGTAYEARETNEELEKMRLEYKKRGKPFVYRRKSYSEEEIVKFKNESRKPVIRLSLPKNNKVVWHDLIKGEMVFDSNTIGDIVIRKGNGWPTYHMAVVVDDFHMEITHILRGEDHIANTPKHIAIYRALGRDIPSFGHMPMILTPQKKKLSKRNLDQGFVYIDQYKQLGFLPEALINYIALLGRHASEDRDIYTMYELIQEFDINRVQRSNAIFDYDRLLRFNAQHLRLLSDSAFKKSLFLYLSVYGGERRNHILEKNPIDDVIRDSIALEMKNRLQFFGQFKDFAYYFFEEQLPDLEIVQNKKMKVTNDMLSTMLPKCINYLKSIQDRTGDNLKYSLLDRIHDKGYKNGSVLRPLRAILTGVLASPGAFEMMSILGKKETIKRLERFYKLNF